MKYQISDVLIQNIVNYLATKPYGEVVTLINALSTEISQNSDINNSNINVANKEE